MPGQEIDEKYRQILQNIVDEEEGMIASRKNLVRQTKEVKQLPLQEQAAQHSLLLKLYQQEIDNLCKMVKNLHVTLRLTIEELNTAPEARDMEEENATLKASLQKAAGEIKDLAGKCRNKESAISVLEQRIREQEATLQKKISELEIQVIRTLELAKKEESKAIESMKHLEEQLKDKEDIAKQLQEQLDQRCSAVLELEMALAEEEKKSTNCSI